MLIIDLLNPFLCLFSCFYFQFLASVWSVIRLNTGNKINFLGCRHP